MGVKIILFIFGLMIGFLFLVLSACVDKITFLNHKIKSLNRDLDILDKEIRIVKSMIEEKANQYDMDNVANAMLNVRNDIGKLGNRLQKLEKEIKE